MPEQPANGKGDYEIFENVGRTNANKTPIFKQNNQRG